MDYFALAEELIQHMFIVNREKRGKSVDEKMRGETFVLGFIREQNAAVVPSEIGDEGCVSSARVAVILNSLERKGLIIRMIDPSDRRRILVNITEEGRIVAEDHKRKMLEHFAQMMKMLGEHDAKEYVRIVKKLSECVEIQKIEAN